MPASTRAGSTLTVSNHAPAVDVNANSAAIAATVIAPGLCEADSVCARNTVAPECISFEGMRGFGGRFNRSDLARFPNCGRETQRLIAVSDCARNHQHRIAAALNAMRGRGANPIQQRAVGLLEAAGRIV